MLQDIAKEALQGVIILLILERLFLTRPVSWMETHVDYLSCQALLFGREKMSLLQQTRLVHRFRTRISD